MYNFVLDLKILCSTLYPLKLSGCQGVLLNLPFKHQACRLTQTASWDVVMRCSLSLLSIVFHCTVQLNVLANRQCVSPGALWCWIGFCGSVRSTDTTDATSLLDVQVIFTRWLSLWSDVFFPVRVMLNADINESRSNGELVIPATIKMGWRPFCVWF